MDSIADTFLPGFSGVLKAVRLLHFEVREAMLSEPSAEPKDDPAYLKSKDEEAALHQPKDGSLVHKYTSTEDDGKQETCWVQNENGSSLLTDPATKATYNWGGRDGLDHGFLDVGPFVIFGNARDDPSIIVERVTKSIVAGFDLITSGENNDGQ